jgi:hypothetical protein
LGVETAEAGTAGAAVPFASSVVLLDNEEQFICPTPLTTSAIKFCNMYFSVVISLNLIILLEFSKIIVFSLISLFSVYSVS